jgi:hypothetical protein
MKILLCNLSKYSIKLLSREMRRRFLQNFCKEKKRRMRESEEESFPFIEPMNVLDPIGLKLIQ